ncbi:MAG: ABC transporter ATP-binding protein [Brevinema sp.]
MSTALILKNISKSFHKQTVLEDINFELEKGKLLTLLGGSGCGKTTTLRIIAGLETPDKGQIFFNTQNITNLPPFERGIGMVFQDYTLFPNMTVFENVAYGLRAKNVSRDLIKTKVLTMLEHLEMTHSEDKFPHQISGGQQQRVALARALIIEPSLLLMDEPFSALDAKIRESLRTLVRKVQLELGITAILVTHDREEALGISDYIAVYNGGRIIQQGSTEELYQHPADIFVADFLTDINVFKHQEKIYQLRPDILQLNRHKGDFKAKISLIKFQGAFYKIVLDYEGQDINVIISNKEFRENIYSLGELVYVRIT